MGLSAEINHVAQAFDYNDADLNNGVREFLSQLGMCCPRLEFVDYP